MQVSIRLLGSMWVVPHCHSGPAPESGFVLKTSEYNSASQWEKFLCDKLDCGEVGLFTDLFHGVKLNVFDNNALGRNIKHSNPVSYLEDLNAQIAVTQQPEFIGVNICFDLLKKCEILTFSSS